MGGERCMGEKVGYNGRRYIWGGERCMGEEEVYMWGGEGGGIYGGRGGRGVWGGGIYGGGERGLWGRRRGEGYNGRRYIWGARERCMG